MRQQSDRLLKLILVLTAFTMIIVWLPLVRGLMDGETYQWGHSLFGIDFGGKGVGGDYWFVVVQGVFSAALIYLGWRGASQPFHWLLLARNVLFAVSAFYSAISFPEQYRFRGDTLGVDVSLAWVAPLFWSVLLLLSIIWVVRDLKRIEPRIVPPWNRTNTILLAITLSFVPLQFVLLRFGEPHGTTDKIGVILTMLQWVLLNVSFGKWRSKELVGVQTAALR
jgi:hypothetical protein